MEFTMKIKLGNAAMQTSDDLATALEKVALRLRSHDDVRFDPSADPDLDETNINIQRGILDANGNYVGEWILSSKE